MIGLFMVEKVVGATVVLLEKIEESKEKMMCPLFCKPRSKPTAYGSIYIGF